MEYLDQVAKLRQVDSELADEVASWLGLEQVLAWMDKRNAKNIDLIGQDEFEYDFLIELTPGGRWVVFGVT